MARDGPGDLAQPCGRAQASPHGTKRALTASETCESTFVFRLRMQAYPVWVRTGQASHRGIRVGSRSGAFANVTAPISLGRATRHEQEHDGRHG